MHVPGDDWQDYLDGLAAFGMRPGLERVSALLDALGRPQDGFRVVHVVGTNGKSSTTRYAAAVLRAHGLRSGAYLSPHITGYCERVLVDGEPVEEVAFARAVRRVRDEIARLPDDLGETTQFEVLTVAALLALAERGVEAVALEAGLGGRLDATNVVEAPVVVLTNVGLEHTEVLGATRAAIFAEKAAVIKGGDAVFGPLDGLEGAAEAGVRARWGARTSARPRRRGRRRPGAVHRADGIGSVRRPGAADARPLPGRERRSGRGGGGAPPRSARPREGARRAPRRRWSPGAFRSSRATRSCSRTGPTTRTASAPSSARSPGWRCRARSPPFSR